MENFSFGSFMHEGGWGMWPVFLIGLGALAAAGRYAARPAADWLRFVATLWLTLLAAVAHAVIIDLAAVFRFLSDPGRAPDAELARLLVTGLKESTRPAALGGIFLTLVPLLVAAGLYRGTIARRADPA